MRPNKYFLIFTACFLGLEQLANAQVQDCEQLLKLQYEQQQIDTDHEAAATLKSWYTSKEFREMYSQNKGGISVAWGGVSLGLNASDEEVQKFQKAISETQDVAVSQQDRLHFLRTKGLESIVTAYIHCKELQSTATEIRASVQPVTPSKEIIVTLTFHSPTGPPREAKIMAEPILLGLKEKGHSNILNGAVISSNQGLIGSYAVEENYPAPVLSVATDYGVVNVPISRFAPEKEDLEKRLADALDQLAQKAKIIGELQRQVDQIPVLQSKLAAAEKWVDMGGMPFHITGDAAIWMVIGKSRAWCMDMRWDPRELGVPVHDELAVLPIFTKRDQLSVGISTVQLLPR
jgi:hypothetical protein